MAQGQLHFETVWDGDEEFEGKELGYWLEDGTLFAVDSRNGEVITYKRKNTVVTEACELNLAASTIENITVEMLGSPYATEQVAGTAKIATSALVSAGVDDTTIVTPKKLKEALSDEQFAKYDATRIYSVGEVCYTKDAETGKVSYWEWYSNVESLAGKDPLDTANRRVGWSDNTKPFYWKPYTAKVPGETMAWDTDSIPENMVVSIGQQLPVAVYHSLASAKPEWIDDVDNTLINIPDRQGRFVRAANGNDWLAGETHEDAIREISGALHTTTGFNPSSATGAFSYDTDTPVASAAGIAVNSTTTRSIDFLASNVVPTASEVQPKAYIEWVGYAL